MLGLIRRLGSRMRSAHAAQHKDHRTSVIETLESRRMLSADSPLLAPELTLTASAEQVQYRALPPWDGQVEGALLTLTAHASYGGQSVEGFIAIKDTVYGTYYYVDQTQDGNVEIGLGTLSPGEHHFLAMYQDRGDPQV